MKLNEAVKAVEAVKGGAFVLVKYQTKQKTFKGCMDEVIKITYGVYRLKCAYGNLNWVKARDTESTEIEPKKVINWVVKNAIDLTEKGYRMWLYTDKHHKAHSEYFCNGEPVTKQYLIENGKCSESMLKGYFKEDAPKNHPIYKYIEDVIEIGA